MIDRFEAVPDAEVPYKQMRVNPDLLSQYMPPSVKPQFPLIIKYGDEKTAAQLFIDDTIVDNRVHIDPLTAHNLGLTDGEKDTVTIEQGTVYDAEELDVVGLDELDSSPSDEDRARIYREAKEMLLGQFVCPGDVFFVEPETLDESVDLQIQSCEPDGSEMFRVAKDSRLKLRLPAADTGGSEVDSFEYDNQRDANMSGKTNTGTTRGRGQQTNQHEEPDVTYESIGGLYEEIKKVREMVEQPLVDPDAFQGVPTPSGVLLYGPPGTGKTMLAKAVANEVDAAYYSLSGAEIFDKNYGESEENLRRLFEDARQNRPSVIFIDELEALVPPRNGLGDSNQVERRVVTQLKTLMDGFETEDQVIVLGATNHPEEIDSAFLRPGRFDRMIEVGVPNKDEREEILQIHTRDMNLQFGESYFQTLIEKTTGYTGADISDLCTKANMHMQRRLRREYADYTDSASVSDIIRHENEGYTREDFENALDETKPSLLSQFNVDVPEVNWTDIGGNSEVKQRVREQVDGPLEAPNLWSDEETSTGVLLYGPPGTGKTLLAKAMATESDRVFIGVQATELRSKWVGETERNIRQLFTLAQNLEPSILYIDEIEAIVQPRGTSNESGVNDEATSQLLSELDGMEEMGDVIVVGSTNAKYDPERPLHRQDNVQYGLDPAILRPGRLELHFHVSEPDFEGRKEIFRIHLGNVSDDSVVELEDNINVDQLAEKTEGASGADIEGICWEAKHISRNKIIQQEGGLSEVTDVENITITHDDLLNAIQQYTEAAATTTPDAFH